MKQFSFGFES